MADAPINPLDLLIKSQQAALKLTTDVLRSLQDAAVAGATQPAELTTQVADMARAVAGMSSAFTGIAGSSVQPLQDFIVRQREIADTVHTLAEAQAQLAGVMASLAEHHADAVNALETVTAPLFAIVGAQPTAPKTRAARKAEGG
ncbi:hypothetical protein FHP29_07575 [Nocardioides albidus]|uniref:Uncharacterized protein n=1 Tax=Nocardioides albidus TaxID=1517589 RepID=A0A5C4W3M6_9ACTN|nr:hypothetical protein [Nocardioides albidus]TNM42847.1 hypothetical protein FHP29_07575 [Nocardioides albidus]